MPSDAYRHCTNLRTPLERDDLSFLVVLRDYRFGDPVPAKHYSALSLEQLKAQGVVGLYTTEEALKDPLVRRMTGWTESVLGRDWGQGS